jgi:hypothetical protein
MKNFASLLLILLLLISSPLSILAGLVKAESSTGFTPQDIILRDDAFHGHRNFPLTEWWYFDAMFDNGYSVQLSVRVINIFGKGIVFERLDLYYNYSIIADQVTIHRITDFFASSEVPFVQLQGKTILSGTQNTTSGFFDYNVSFEYPGCAALLHFIGCTQGWKGQQKSGEWWAVAVPRADVTGQIIVNNETIYVTGNGYHDHNWDVTAKSLLRFGWFWGKFNSPGYTVTWSALLPTRTTMKPILVLNRKNAGYLGVPSSEVWFSLQDVHLNHLMRVPYFFNIATMTGTVFLIVDMEVIHVDYKHLLGSMQYWRFHVKCIGTILTDGHAEIVDDVFIAEYIRFR